MGDSTLINEASPIPSTSDDAKSEDVKTTDAEVNDEKLATLNSTPVVNDEGETKKEENVLEEKEMVAVEAESVPKCIPCFVRLEILPPEVIEQYTKRSTSNGCENTRILRVPEAIGNSAAFQEFRKSRNEFLDKQKRKASEAFYGSYSGDELSFPSDEDFFPKIEEELESQGKVKRRRKKLNYEDDTEWSPPCDYKGTLRPTVTRLKKTKSLRVNTRRKRIESASSESTDEEYNAKKYSTRTKIENTIGPQVEVPRDVPQEENNAASTLQPAKKKSGRGRPKKETKILQKTDDNDVVAKILRDMELQTQSTIKTGSEAGLMRKVTNNFPYPQPKKRRIARVFSTSNPAAAVRKLVKDMLTKVCSMNSPKPTAVTEKRKKCKWCATPFPATNPSETYCAICLDLGMNDQTLAGKQKKPKVVRTSPKVVGGPPVKNKMIHRVFKNLPKYEKQKIMYNNKANAVEKGYNHCKSLHDAKDLKDSSSATEGTVKKKKTKSKPDGSKSLTKVMRKKKVPVNENSNANVSKKTSQVQIRAAEALKSVSGSSQTQVSLTGIDKGLFLMTFPEPHHGLDAAKSTAEQTARPPQKPGQNAVTNNVQYGTYLLPPVPTVVVANYATSDVQSGDYYLSSVYYQNEMSRSKNTPVGSGGAQNNLSAPPALPSMPSIDQLSNKTDSSHNSPSPQFENASVGDNVASPPLLYSNLPSISDLLDSPRLEIDQSFEPRTNVEEIFRNNPQIQIEPLPFQMPKELLGEDQVPITDGTEEPLEEQRVSEQDPESGRLMVDENALINTESTVPSRTDEGDSNNASKSEKRSSGDTEDPSSKLLRRLISEGVELLNKSSAELDAICIMSVVDLASNPKVALQGYLDNNQIDYEKLKSSPSAHGDSTQQKMKAVIHNGAILKIAKRMLQNFGSFTKLSDSFLRRAKLMQIKKEAFETDTTSSCQFAAKTGEILPPTEEEESQEKLQVHIKVEKMSACSQQQQNVPVNFISKIQSQVDNMQDASSGGGAVVHHFPGLATPRSDLLNCESRETPSRGSGPRTPARPESAMSQAAEDLPLTPLQIKKERMEASASPLSQCAYASSQNVSSSPRQSPIVAATAAAYPMATPSLIPQLLNQRSSNNMVPAPPSYMQFQNTAPPNVTVPFGGTTFQKVLVNMSPKQQQQQPAQQQIDHQNVLIKNGQMYNVQQVYLPARQQPPPQLQAQTTTAVVTNMNQLVFKQSSNIMTGVPPPYPMQNQYANIPVSSSASQAVCGPSASVVQQPGRVPANQVPSNSAFLLNQNKVVYFEIQRPQ